MSKTLAEKCAEDLIALDRRASAREWNTNAEISEHTRESYQSAEERERKRLLASYGAKSIGDIRMPRYEFPDGSKL